MKGKSLGGFRSGFEKSVAASLSSRGVGYAYEAVEIPWKKPQRINRKTREAHGLSGDDVRYTYHMYTVDFSLVDAEGRDVYIETKGRWTPGDRTKIKAIVTQNPEINLVMLFQSDNKIHPGSKTRYSDFCIKNGIQFKVGKHSIGDILHGKY